MELEKLREVLADEAFVKELMDMESAEQVQDALDARGVELSTDDILQIGDFLRKIQTGEISQEKLEAMANGELSEDELEEVAGGFAIAIGIGVLATIGFISSFAIRGW